MGRNRPMGYGYGGCAPIAAPVQNNNNGFILLVVLFVLLVIIGNNYGKEEHCPPGTVPVD
ncbi:YjcZ family sporulation protein [Virgibacillus sp. DJP39]|uniref:YjcZ family sporulation protein n=1 Tax=Virgibacillus sp. DJP39 TaxID=3409790 RepID=UPI003BB5ECB0